MPSSVLPTTVKEDLTAKTEDDFLEEGKYELQVFNLEPGKGSFELLIDRVDN